MIVIPIQQIRTDAPTAALDIGRQATASPRFSDFHMEPTTQQTT